MKEGIHPEYDEITVELSDGTKFKTRSTLNAEEGVYRSEVDSKNHPFYTNKQQYTQKAGQVDRFHQRYGSKSQGEGEESQQAEDQPEKESEEEQ